MHHTLHTEEHRLSQQMYLASPLLRVVHNTSEYKYLNSHLGDEAVHPLYLIVASQIDSDSRVCYQ